MSTKSTNSSKNKMVLGAFLVKFDVKSGNSLIWSESQPGVNVDWSGIEFMAMPSGLHAKEKDVIRFVVSSSIRRNAESNRNVEDPVFRDLFSHVDDHIEGIAVFKQNLGGAMNASHTGTDRSKVRMYSLGILCPKGNSEISSKCWGFVDIISGLLDTFMKNEEEVADNDAEEVPLVPQEAKFTSFRTLLEYEDDHFSLGPPHHHAHSNSNNNHHLSSLNLDLGSNHPILATTELLDVYGPLIFELWKSTLLRDRILLMDPSRTISIETLCAFVYILTVFGTVPNDVFELIPRHRQQSQVAGANPIYNITISDIPALHTQRHYIATTSDEIIIEKSHLYDLVVLTAGDEVIAKRSTIDIPGIRGPDGRLSAGYHDKRRFQILMSSLGLNHLRHKEGNSIFAHLFSNISSLFSLSALYGLIWWATAGEQANLDSDRYLEGLPLLMPSSSDGTTHGRSYESESPYFGAVIDSTPAVPLNEPWQISVIGYFQAKTRRIFQTVASLVEAQDTEQADSALETVITIEPPDLMDMGLDPISARDHEFVVEFINIWWGRPARVNHICC